MKKLLIVQKLQKGFTLIELLIVIAVLGVLAAVVVSAIDPLDKIAAGNDAKVIQDISVLANSLEAYAVVKGGYPNPLSDLVTNGDLKVIPSPPSGYTTCTSYNYTPVPSTGLATSFTLSCQLKSKKFDVAGVHQVRKYESSTAKLCNVASAATPCP